MNERELNEQLSVIKSDYARIQGDLEKMESAGGNTTSMERQLETLEQELASLKKQLAAEKSAK
ncbi:hypothetical protein N781_00495 [Pontibacillus halophilus JSM 076056 = DSM 19796]|uniref:Uncharacterized protein n=1 Tax=Pontibacillus halophilus JSM 076056 = DSM 19796 TaxID=1385510 RepID=A0A0A5GR38_9BACI|nr:SE1832 family protein [Pontibacillus halophilus]KGX93718.1 hypothetical protein N781_00495 [Pontibacillus halophilus JSM 076056 = DSM 19796]